MSAWEVEKSRKIFLKGPLAIKLVQRPKDETLGKTLASCDKIITVCAALTNIGESVVYKV